MVRIGLRLQPRIELVEPEEKRHEEHGKQRQDACRRLQRLAYRASPAAAGERVQHQIGQGTQRDAEEK